MHYFTLLYNTNSLISGPENYKEIARPGSMKNFYVKFHETKKNFTTNLRFNEFLIPRPNREVRSKIIF